MEIPFEYVGIAFGLLGCAFGIVGLIAYVRVARLEDELRQSGRLGRKAFGQHAPRF